MRYMSFALVKRGSFTMQPIWLNIPARHRCQYPGRHRTPQIVIKRNQKLQQHGFCQINPNSKLYPNELAQLGQRPTATLEQAWQTAAFLLISDNVHSLC